ncbi:MAG: hypothetical protein HOC71_13275 [Candidatus Latescibacteria bacterium]|jgi:hypothetical protein|nr:hypothetical protein [Candidatus Latescibacterota bacterium]
MEIFNKSRRNFLARAALGIPSLVIFYPCGAKVESQPLTICPPTGIKYRNGIIDKIQLVRKANAELFDKVADIGARAYTSGHKCYAYMHAGHTHNADNFEGRIGLPKLFIPCSQKADMDQIEEGDLLVCTSGDNPPMPEAILKKKATLVTWTYPYGGDANHLFEHTDTERAKGLKANAIGKYADVMIDTFQEPPDGTTEIPGIRAKFGAQSGPLVMSIFWIITLRIVELLAEKNIELEVYS